MFTRTMRRLAFIAALAAPLTGCDLGYGILSASGNVLDSGVYEYEAWSDLRGRGPSWWGVLDIQVDYDGRIYGSYLLPEQCDEGRYLVDCRGRIGGRAYRDGTIRFGFDEGWISNRGRIRQREEAQGDWDTRLLGYRDGGRFEMWPYRGRSRW